MNHKGSEGKNGMKMKRDERVTMDGGRMESDRKVRLRKGEKREGEGNGRQRWGE